MTKSPLLPLLCLLIALNACTQQQSAPIEQRGDQFFGKNATFDAKGNELPRYNNAKRATLPTQQAEKYVDDSTHNYGVSATINAVSSNDLAPIESTSGNNTEAAPQAVKNTYSDTQQFQERRQAQSTATSRIEEATRWTGQEERETASTTPSFVWPLKGRIVKKFDERDRHGISINGRTGEPVRASSDGTVVYVGDRLEDFGNMIIIQHNDEYVTTYAHLGSSVVSKNTDVMQGQLIGFVGRSGNVDSSQLHFSMRQGSTVLNPTTILPKR